MTILETTSAAPPTARIPRALFSRGFDDFATWWHKDPANPASRDLAESLIVAEGLRVCDALIASPRVSFKVHGENLVLPKLIETFGIARLEALLEEDAVEFVLWRPSIGVPRGQAEAQSGACPLVAVNLTNPAFCDPERSTAAGLRMWSGASFRNVQRLARLATERTWMPAEESPDEAVRAVCDAYGAGRLRADGFDPEVPLGACSIPDFGRLRQLAERVLEGIVLARAGYVAHESPATWEAVRKVGDGGEDGAEAGAESVATIEGVPAIGRLVGAGAIDVADVPRIRRSEATERLRRWLWSAPSAGAWPDAGRAYLAAIAPAVSATATRALEAARIVTVRAPAQPADRASALPAEPAGADLRHLAFEVRSGETPLRVPLPSGQSAPKPNRRERRAAKGRGFGNERRQ